MATSKKASASPATRSPAQPKMAKPALKKSPIRKAAAGKPLSPAPLAKKAGAKTGAKAGAKAPLSKVLTAAKPDKAAKPKKPKLVRDSFTIPKAEYLVLEGLKQRAAQLTRPAKKSEVLRAGIKALAALSDAAFLMALEQVPAIKTGRPTLSS